MEAIASAKFVTIEVSSNYGNNKESAVAKSLHSRAVHNEICQEKNLGDDVLETLSKNFTGTDKDLDFFKRNI